MPFKDYAVIALIALAAWVCWDWLDTRDALAADNAKNAATITRLQDSVRSANATIDAQKRERESTQRALAHVSALARKAQAEADNERTTRRDLARADQSVRTYLDDRMPRALFDQLCSEPDSCARRAEGGGATGSVVHGTGTDPVIAR
jgi:hypothetical protein